MLMKVKEAAEICMAHSGGRKLHKKILINFHLLDLI